MIRNRIGTSLVVHALIEVCAVSAGGLGLIPG